MTTPDPLDDALVPFSVVFQPAGTEFAYMELARGKSAGFSTRAAVPEAALMVHGRWDGTSRARLFFNPGGGGAQQHVATLYGTPEKPATIPATQLAVLGPGAYFRADASSMSPEEAASVTLLLNVIPVPYS